MGKKAEITQLKGILGDSLGWCSKLINSFKNPLTIINRVIINLCHFWRSKSKIKQNKFYTKPNKCHEKVSVCSSHDFSSFR